MPCLTSQVSECYRGEVALPPPLDICPPPSARTATPRTPARPLLDRGGEGKTKTNASRFFGRFFFLRNWANSPLPLSVLSFAPHVGEAME